MTNQLKVQHIDVCQEFFYVDDGPIKRYSSIFEVDDTIVMNKVMLKKDAIDYAKKMFYSEKNIFSSLRISLDALNVIGIEDFFGEKIFSADYERYCGWLIQYDPTPFANWYHECYYYFLIDKECYYMTKSMHGLSDSITMQNE